MNKDGFTKKLTVEQAEAEYMVTSDRLGPTPVPFGFLNDMWCDLLAQMQPGDEIWAFGSDSHSWKNRCGRAGVALVRDDKVVFEILTRMN